MQKTMLFNVDKALKNYPARRHGEVLVRRACMNVVEEAARSTWPISPSEIIDRVNRRYPQFVDIILRIILESTRDYPRARARARDWLTPQRAERLKNEAAYSCSRKHGRWDLSA